MKRYFIDGSCETLERDIQNRAGMKDSRFRLGGTWKGFVRSQRGFKVYAVVGEWIRSNLSVIFGHGGHGYVHEFIPLNEIWIDVEHHRNGHYNCGCSNRFKGGRVSDHFFNETVRHEIAEATEMAQGKPFWRAHQVALVKEKEE